MLSPKETLHSVAKRMKELKTSAFVVVDESKKVIGIISEQDIVRRACTLNKTMDEMKAMSVTEVMTKNPYCLRNHPNIEEEALNLMSEKNFRHVPLVDDLENKTYLRSLDILEAANYIGNKNSNFLFHEMGKISKKLLKMFSVSHATQNTQQQQQPEEQSNNCSLMGSTTISDACKYFLKEKISAVLVLNKFGSTAIVTESDIIRRCFAEEDCNIHKATLFEIMTPNPTSVRVDMEPKDVLKTMLKKHFRHLPVKESKGENIIAILDILTVLKKALGVKDKESNLTIVSNDAKLVHSSFNNTKRKTSNQGEEGEEEKSKKLKEEENAIETIPSIQQAAQCLAKQDFASAIGFLTIALGEVKNREEIVKLTCKRGFLKQVTGDCFGAMDDFNFVMNSNLSGERIEKVKKDATIANAELLFEANQIERSFELLDQMNDDAMVNKFLSGFVKAENEKMKASAKSLFSQKQFEDAINFFTKSIRIESNLAKHQQIDEESRRRNAVTFSNRAACYQALKHFEMAIEDLRESLKWDETYEKAWIRMLACLESTGADLERNATAQKAAEVLERLNLPVGQEIAKHRNSASLRVPVCSAVVVQTKDCVAEDELFQRKASVYGGIIAPPPPDNNENDAGTQNTLLL